MWMQMTNMGSKFYELSSFFQIDLWTWSEENAREVYSQAI